MSAFLVTLIVILLVIAIMAIGVMFGRRPIAGSCGGLAQLGLECECDNPCPRKLARMRAQAEAERAGEQDNSRNAGEERG